MSKRRKILLISIGIIVLILIIVLITNLVRRGDEGEDQALDETLFPIEEGERILSPGEQGFALDTSFVGRNIDGTNIPILRKLSDEPVAGFVAFEIEIESEEENFQETPEGFEEEVETETIFRFARRQNGHILDASSDNLDINRISNVSILKVYDAIFSSNGESFIYRLLDDDMEKIRTFNGAFSYSIDEETGERHLNEEEIEGYFLNKEVSSASVSPLGNQLAFIEKGITGSNLSIFTFNTESPVSILPSRITQWQVQWPAEDLVTLTTNGDSRMDGLMFDVNANTGIFNTYLKGKRGLTTLTSPDGQTVIFSESNNNGNFETKILDKASRNVVSTNLDTLPEKCVWSKIDPTIAYCAAPAELPSASYPEDWYQGKVSFDDFLVKIDTDTLEMNLVTDLETTDEDIQFDIIKPQLSPDEEHLMFVNKRDLSLWVLDLATLEQNF